MKMMMAVTILALAALAVADAEWAMGDVDAGGDVTCTDAQLVLDYSVTFDATKLDTSLADVSGDREITAYDSALIQQMAGGCNDSPTSTQSQTWADVKKSAMR